LPDGAWAWRLEIVHYRRGAARVALGVHRPHQGGAQQPIELGIDNGGEDACERSDIDRHPQPADEFPAYIFLAIVRTGNSTVLR